MYRTILAVMLLALPATAQAQLPDLRWHHRNNLEQQQQYNYDMQQQLQRQSEDQLRNQMQEMQNERRHQEMLDGMRRQQRSYPCPMFEICQ